MVGKSSKNGAWGVVYTLCDGKNNVFYVGATIVKLSLRLNGHFNEARVVDPLSEKSKVIQKLKYKVTITPIDWIWIESDDLNKVQHSKEFIDLERKWIGWHIKNGFPITNRLIPFKYKKVA